MRISSVANVNFSSVTPVVTNARGERCLKHALQKDGCSSHQLSDYTEIYTNNEGTIPNSSFSLLSKAAKEGKKIFLLITGKDFLDYDSATNGKGKYEPRWHINQDTVEVIGKNDKAISDLVKRTWER